MGKKSIIVGVIIGVVICVCVFLCTNLYYSLKTTNFATSQKSTKGYYYPYLSDDNAGKYELYYLKDGSSSLCTFAVVFGSTIIFSDYHFYPNYGGNVLAWGNNNNDIFIYVEQSTCSCYVFTSTGTWERNGLEIENENGEMKAKLHYGTKQYTEYDISNVPQALLDKYR